MSINNRILNIRDMFEVFDDPMDKYTQIIEFGKKNNGLKEEEKNETNRIYGCASLAWVKTEKKLRLIKKRDRIKNKWARERGYRMIRINYTEQNKIGKIL